MWQGIGYGELTLGGQMLWDRSRHCLSDSVGHNVWSPSAEPAVGRLFDLSFTYFVF